MIAHTDVGEGPALVLVHGLFGSSVYWQPVIDAFRNQRRVVVPDLAGFGRSGAHTVPADIPCQAKLVLDLLDQLDIERFDLVGYSMGGMVAQQIALMGPRRVGRLINYATKPVAQDTDRFEPFTGTIARLQAEPLMVVAEANIRKWFAKPPEPAQIDLCRHAANGATSESVTAALRAVEGWDIRAELGDLKMPVLVISGDRDRSISVSTLVTQFTAIPDARLCILPGCGHIAHLEQPDHFLRIIGEFLADGCEGGNDQASEQKRE
ncbi:alpha/beta fold hydrolase [Oceanibium sediminis]|uniref:alpha/beta fold hydrolase n=1 Tax=Oceanibium sediminis TaxID=2026339 RepID=UPI000DD38A31|nr:alpha/beta fold hydrolase [Oceanibium sediminis]